ncbi:MAG: hypothetical protein ACPL6F_00540 [Anaerolineales bacterium]
MPSPYNSRCQQMPRIGWCAGQEIAYYKRFKLRLSLNRWEAFKDRTWKRIVRY